MQAWEAGSGRDGLRQLSWSLGQICWVLDAQVCRSKPREPLELGSAQLQPTLRSALRPCCAAGLIASTFWMPNSALNGFGQAARVFSGLFIILQVRAVQRRNHGRRGRQRGGGPALPAPARAAGTPPVALQRCSRPYPCAHLLRASNAALRCAAPRALCSWSSSWTSSTR